MPNYYYTTAETLTSIADAIRARTNSNQLLLFPNDFRSKVYEIDTQISYTGIAKRWVEGTMTADDFNAIVYPSKKMFYRYPFSTSEVAFNNCAYILGSTFYRVSNVTHFSFPKCSQVGIEAFAYCYALQTIDLPVCTEIFERAFYGISTLTEINLPKVSYINISTFASCTNLVSFNAPECRLILSSAFRDCGALQDISLPVCGSIYTNAFAACSSLESITLPECRSIDSCAFISCTALTTVTLNNCVLISSSAFKLCFSLQSLYLLQSFIPRINYRDVFYGTRIDNGSGHIYVPSSLYDAYLSSNNWLHYSSIIVPV